VTATSDCVFAGFPAVGFRSSLLECLAVPALGGKIVSLRSRMTGREWLWQDHTRAYREARYGDEFAAYDISGFDECFPTIGPCRYPAEPWQGIDVPDHGEVWSVPWAWSRTDDTIDMHVDGARLPYRLDRTISAAAGGGIMLRYRLTNHSDWPLRYLWSAHPLFGVRHGMTIRIPGHPQLLRELRMERNGGPTSELVQLPDTYLSVHTWPEVATGDGTLQDLSTVDMAHPMVDKLFAGNLDEGRCTLEDPEADESLTISFSTAEVPFLGLCFNTGAWPADGRPGEWLAIEPCSGRPDRLDVAVQRGEHSEISPQGTREWSLELATGSCEQRPQRNGVQMNEGL